MMTDSDGRPRTSRRDRLEGKQRANQQEIERGKDEFLLSKKIVIFDGEVASADCARQRLSAHRLLLG